MTIYPIISKSLRYLFTQKLRAISSLIGVLFGVLSVITMLSIGEGAKKESIEQIHLLGINNIIIKQIPLSQDQQLTVKEKRSPRLSLKDVTLIKKTLPDIQNVVPIKVIEANVQGRAKEMSPLILSTTENFRHIYDLSLKEGRFLSDFDQKRRQFVCVLGEDLALQLGKEGHPGKLLRIENQLFTIVGVLKSRTWKKETTNTLSAHNLNQTIFIPLGSEKGLPINIAKEQDPLSEIIIQVSDKNKILPLSQIIDRSLEVSHYGVKDYQMIIPQELIQQAHKTQQTFNLVLGSIAFISLLVGGIGIMNIMLATISERTREIGIRRAVGASKRHILLQFLSETLILTLLGAVLGIIIGITFAKIISFYAGWKTVTTTWSILLSLFLASIVGIFSGIYPAIKASNLDPITALRSY